ncbi:hypothetical protein [Acinetobacter pittii]|uniref:hypothetical protein n=1 Tax=Acinetobacter pittii TaxID=48296 RepID=UPI00301B7F75
MESGVGRIAMDLDLELKAFMEVMKKNGCPMWMFERDEDGNFEDMTMAHSWYAWQEKAKAQAVPDHTITLQRNGEVFKFDLLDLLRRSLKSSKVLKTRENWSHVSKMIGIGSTTATLLCKEMNVDPDGTVFVASESGAEG